MTRYNAATTMSHRDVGERAGSIERLLRNLSAPVRGQRPDAAAEALRAKLNLCSEILSALAPSRPKHDLAG